MAGWAMRTAIRESLRVNLTLQAGEIRTMPGPEPTAIASAVFFAVHPGSWDAEIKDGRQLHENLGVDVTISVRGTHFGGDRWGSQVVNANLEDGLEYLARLAIVALHSNTDVMDMANNNLATLNPGFVTAPYFLGASGGYVKRPASWWDAATDEPNEGFSVTLRFGNMLRVQEIGNMD